MKEHFQEKIERTLAFFETQATKIDEAYLAEVEKLASRTRDNVLADFYRSTMKPSRILSVVESVRDLLEAGDIVKADQELERLQTNLQFVEAHLQHPRFVAGIKTSRGGTKGAENKWGSAADRARVRQEMQTSFEDKRRQGASVTEAEQMVARAFSISTRAVRKARTGK